MKPRKTCDKCARYTPAEQYTYPGAKVSYAGECALMEDANDFPEGEEQYCNGWDYEGYRAGVHVGPKFGCIHWVKKER
jgi:hypothetical protein